MCSNFEVCIHEFSKVLSLTPVSESWGLQAFLEGKLLALVFEGHEGDLINVMIGYLASFPDKKGVWDKFVKAFEENGRPVDVLVNVLKRAIANGVSFKFDCVTIDGIARGLLDEAVEGVSDDQKIEFLVLCLTCKGIKKCLCFRSCVCWKGYCREYDCGYREVCC
jgi:hypothetical protein